MQGPVPAVVSAFSESLKRIAPVWTARQRSTRALLSSDSLEQVVSDKLLKEGVERYLKGRDGPSDPLVIFMDRSGGAQGARAAEGLMPLIGHQWQRASFVQVSFDTPARGLGKLIRNTLTMKGAEHGVNVYLVAHNRPFCGLDLSESQADDLVRHGDLVITFAASGSAGLADDAPGFRDRLIERSHLAVLSYPDPESVVAEIANYERRVSADPALTGVRFTFQVEEGGTFEPFGVAVLGQGGDARDRLWVLVDNARRRRYRVLIEPMVGDRAAGRPLVSPCGSVLRSQLGQVAAVERVVPAGATLVAVARGRQTLV